MSLSYAILGLLSHEPQTGYELKKIMQASSFMHWSASNNQIYSTLTDLKKEGYVTSETLVQQSLPSKKRYAITRDGLDALKKWTMSHPEQPEFKKAFLIQLAWSEQLSNRQLHDLLNVYEREIKGRIALENKAADGAYSPARSPREKAIWKWIQKSHVSSYENELLWLAALRAELMDVDCSKYEDMNDESNAGEREMKMFNYRAISNRGSGYIELQADGRMLVGGQDALDVIALCVENGMRKVLINDGALSADFFRLKTGVAGSVLQKFSNYNVKLAIVVDQERMSDRFKELSYELNNGTLFGVFPDSDSAEKWLAEGAGQ